MADGTFAAAWLLIGLLDMGFGGCAEDGGCLARFDSAPRMNLSVGEVLERRAEAAAEAYLRLDTGRRFGPWGETMGISIGEKGEVWAGYGWTYTYRPNEGWFFAELHFMPGFYRANNGFDLGGPLAFRSGLEIGIITRDGTRFGISYDHRSNGGIFRHNPGVETAQIRVGHLKE